MTGWKLFKARLIDDFLYQRKVFGSVIDWIVLFYIILPTFVIGTIIYIDIWINIESYWFDFIPFSVIVNILLLLSLLGKFRTFMLEADILFLLDRSNLYKSLREWAFTYSLLKLSISTTLIFVFVLPFLVQVYGLGWMANIFLLIFLIGFRLTAYTLKKYIRHPVLRWITLIAMFFITANLAPIFRFDILSSIGIILISSNCIWYLLKVVPTKHAYFQEVANESKERMRYLKMIFGVAREVERPPISLGKRPLLNRRSRRLFSNITPEKGLLELLLKGFIRNSIYITSYLQIISITFFAIIVLPLWGKWFVFLLVVLFFQYNLWLRGLFERMLDQDFFSVVPTDKWLREQVWIRFKRWLMVPAISFLGIATIVLSVLAILGGV